MESFSGAVGVVPWHATLQQTFFSACSVAFDKTNDEHDPKMIQRNTKLARSNCRPAHSTQYLAVKPWLGLVAVVGPVLESSPYSFRINFTKAELSAYNTMMSWAASSL